MSLDNGVYIARFIEPDGEMHFRVAEIMAVENLEYRNRQDSTLTDAYVVLWYGNKKKLHSLAAAQIEARRIGRTVGYLEYGTTELHIDRPFPKMSLDEARRKINQLGKSG